MLHPDVHQRQGTGHDLIAELVDSHLDQPSIANVPSGRVAQGRNRRSDLILRIVLVALIGLVAGVGVTLFVFDVQPTSEDEKREQSGKDELEEALDQTGLQVHAIEWAQEISHDQPYLVMGARDPVFRGHFVRPSNA